MTPITICVPWMTGRRCVRIVSARLRDLPGVDLVHADPSAGALLVLGSVTAEQVRAAVAEAEAEAECQAIGDGGTYRNRCDHSGPPSGTTGQRT
jgi:copper chaperone